MYYVHVELMANIRQILKPEIDFAFFDQMLPTFSSNLLNMNPFTKGEK